MRNATITRSALLPLTRNELLLLLEGLALLPDADADALLGRLASLRGPQRAHYAEEAERPRVHGLSFDLTLCLVSGI